jgi:cobalt/nickel transport system permease protein
VHVHTFDRYQQGYSLVHRLDPRVKVGLTFLFIFSNLLLPDGAWVGFGLSWGLVLLATAFSSLSLGYTLKRSLIALPFALAAASVLFSLPGQAVAQIHLGPLHLVITDAGLLRFISILVRSWLSIQMAVLLVATTQFPDLLHALRHLQVPGVLISIISFMYRYLFVLSDEALRLLRARQARSAAAVGGSKAGGSLSWRARVAGSMVGQLFLRSYERSDRIYNAMLARGYSGSLLTLNPHLMKDRDWLVLSLVLLILSLIQWVARSAMGMA